MAYLTDRKRAEGLGASHTGTAHHWQMTVTGAALAILLPLFIFTFGCALGGTYEEVTSYYSRPFPAIVTALTLIVSLVHFKNGAKIWIEDYMHGLTAKVVILGVTFLSYALIATGLFALVRLAL